MSNLAYFSLPSVPNLLPSPREIIKYGPVPEELAAMAKQKRAELIETLADHDEEMADLFLSEQDPTPEQLKVRLECQPPTHSPTHPLTHHSLTHSLTPTHTHQ